MPIIQKDTFKQNLDQVSVLIKDTDPNSLYFKVTNLPDTLSGGKNAFLIQGSPQLVADTLVKIEIKDSFGNPIYTEPAAGIPEYYEGTSKVVAVHIYPSTGFGPATITILGELSHFLDGELSVPIPSGWKDKYNVKWQKTININPFLQNTTPIRFYRRPKIDITEAVLPIYNRNVITNTVYGNISGVAINPIQDSDWKSFKGNLIYQIATTSSFFSQSMEGRQIEINGLSTQYTPILTDVTTDTTALVSYPYYITSSASPYYQQIKSFNNATITASFEESVNLTTSNINTSFARIKITDLETFTGDAARIKVYASSRNDLGDYELLEDTLLESNEILKVDEFNGQLNVRTGIFTQPTLDTFWKIENINTTGAATIDNQLLLHSAKLVPAVDATSPLNANPKFKFTSSGSINFTKFTQYQLDFTPIMSSSLGYALMEVYMSGSAFVPTDNTTKYGKRIGEYESNYPFRKYDKQQISFQPDADGTGQVVFLIKGGKWHIGNVSLSAAQETSFSPNEIDLVVNVPVKINNETFDFKFELYDINNNYVPIDLVSSATFVGGNDVSVTRDLQIQTSNQYFNFSTDAQFPSSITIDWTKTGLTGSVTFASAALDNLGNYITPRANYPGQLTYVDDDTKILTISNFTSSVILPTGSYVGAITYTASCEDIRRYFTIFRVDQGAPSYLFYATADKNNFTFNPDNNDISVVQNDYIDIRLVQQNLPSKDATGLLILSASEFGTPPPLYYTGSAGNASVYRLFVSTSADTTPSNYSGYTYKIGQSTYDFELHTIDGVFTSSITVDAVAQGSASKALIATSDINQFTYRNTDLSAVPNPQTATILVKRQNLSSSNAPITVNSGSGKPPLTLLANEVTNGVAKYTISTLNYPYLSGSTTYIFTASDKNGIQYTDDITINPVLVSETVAASFSNENTSLPAYSTGFVKSASFAATSGSVTVTAGTQNISYANPIQNNTYSASIASTTGATATTTSGSYSVSNMTQDSASVNLNVTYQSGTGTQTTFTKTVTLTKAKVSPPTVTMNITNNNQSIQTNSKGVQTTNFAQPVVTVVENYNNATTNLTPTVTITNSAGYSGSTASGGTITLANLDTGVDAATVTLSVLVTDSEGVQRTLPGTITLSKVKNAPPLINISVAPLTQTVQTNSRGSSSVAPPVVQIYADESGTAKSVAQVSAPVGTKGLVPTFSPGTPGSISFNAPDNWWADSVTFGMTVGVTDSELSVVYKYISGSISKAKAAVPVTVMSATPQSQTVTYDGNITYGTPSAVTIAVNEGAGNYTYSSTMTSATAVSTFTITAVSTGVTNNSNGTVTPQQPSTTSGTNGTATISYKNSEGTIVTGSVISFNVGVSLKGTDGGAGPGVVFRGTYDTSGATTYYKTTDRVDVVKGSDGNFYSCLVTHVGSAANAPITGASYATYWVAFGASFSAVATDILLAQNATIGRGLVLGTIDSVGGFIRSANATSFLGGKGFYLDTNGSLKLGDTGSAALIWDNTKLSITGSLNATTGSIGGWRIDSTALVRDTTVANQSAGMAPDDWPFYAGAIYTGRSTAPFRVSNTGAVTATSVTITNSTVGPVTSSATKLYLGVGTFDNNNTPFYVDTTPNFSLGTGLKWSGTALTVSGSMYVNGSSTFNSGISVGTSGNISGNGKTYGSSTAGFFLGYDTTSTAAYKFDIGNSLNYLRWSGAGLEISGSIKGPLQFDSGGSVSSSIVTVDGKIFTDNAGFLAKPVGTLKTGLVTASDYIGFYNNSTAGGKTVGWKSYMDSAGNFYLNGTGGTGLSWNSTSNALAVDGTIYGRSGAFTGTVTATGGAIGSWAIAGGLLQSTYIKLDADNNTISINNTSNTPSVLISNKAAFQTTISGGSVSGYLNSVGVSASPSGNNGTAVNYAIVQSPGSSTLAAAKTYSIQVTYASISGFNAVVMNNFCRRLSIDTTLYIRNTNNNVNAAVASIYGTAWDTDRVSYDSSYNKTFTTTITVPNSAASGDLTFYFYYKTTWSAYADQGVVISNSSVTMPGVGSSGFPQTLIAETQNIVEIIAGGIQVLSNSAYYVKLPSNAGATNYPLQVAGVISATGDIIAFSSDERIKKILGVIENPLDKLSKIDGVYYKWNRLGKKYGYKDKKKHIGLLAQQVQKIFPEIVTLAPFDTDENGKSKSGENYLTIHYQKLVPVLVEAIKELKAEINELKKRIK